MTNKYPAKRESRGRVRHLPSGRYQASYPGPDGVVYNAPRTFANKTDARAWKDAQLVDIDRGVWKSPKAASAETFRVYAETWTAQRVTTKTGQPLRPKTRAEYERQLQKGLAEFADDKLTMITPARVRTWHASRMKAGKTAAGAEARLLRAILTTAVEDGILASVPVPAKLTKSSAGRKHRVPTADELRVLVDAVGDRFRLGVLIAAYGGLRLSEWRALRRRDLALVDGRYVIDVHRQAQYIQRQGWEVGPPKSERGIRSVVLPSWMTETVESHLDAHVGAFPEALVFAPLGSSEFVHDSDFNKAWNIARDAAGVRSEVREHDLRGFGGSHLMQTAGGSLIDARDFLGHSSTAVTERHYMHKVNDRAAEFADKMPQLPKAKPTNVTQLPTGTTG